MLVENINNLPNEPGIYKYYNKEKEILYVGKAKNLKKRVQSYFRKDSSLNRKTKSLVKQIYSIEYTVVQNETDALLLENNLIKKLQPKYNIMLKDGKSYPFICITDERFPRIISVRNKNIKGEYHGPYSSVNTVNTLINLFHTLFPLRTCKYELSEKNIENKKFKACLEYQIGNCNAPCINIEDEITYNKYIEECKSILIGKLSSSKQLLKQEMQFFASNYEFEKAEISKKKLISLENYQNKSTIVSNSLTNLDVVTTKSINKTTALNHLKIENGNVIFTKTIEIKSKIELTNEEILEKYILNVDSNANRNKVILTNYNIPTLNSIYDIQIPKIGDKHKLVLLSIKNCLTFIKEKEKSQSDLNRKKSGLSILEQVKQDLKLKEIPFQIECFDNSNLQGTTPVASMVCFKNSLPSKKDYRHFNIKTVVGPDDFASMKEIVFRRYSRLIKENKELPQLIVIDGGKGQLSHAYESIKELKLENKVVVISIAKRLEEIYYPNDEFPLYLNKNSTTLKLIQRLRDEAHRFAITFHRQKRTKANFNISLSNIEGIGEKTLNTLLDKYKSIKNIKEAPLSELEFIVGKSKALKIKKGM